MRGKRKECKEKGKFEYLLANDPCGLFKCGYLSSSKIHQLDCSKKPRFPERPIGLKLGTYKYKTIETKNLEEDVE